MGLHAEVTNWTRQTDIRKVERADVLRHRGHCLRPPRRKNSLSCVPGYCPRRLRGSDSSLLCRPAFLGLTCGPCCCDARSSNIEACSASRAAASLLNGGVRSRAGSPSCGSGVVCAVIIFECCRQVKAGQI